VELNTAVRGFDYSTFGSGVTWKTGGLWRMIKGVSVRGTYSTAFKAPSIGQLFSGQSDSFPAVTDPCDTSMGDPSPIQQANCAAQGVPDDYQDDRVQIRSRVGGNPDLEPETAKIFTAGAVYEPHFLPGFAATVDYFNINITNSIQRATASVILSSCYSQENPPENCSDLVVRDPDTGFIIYIVDLQTNIGGAATAGVDFNFRYEHMTNVGRFRHNLEGTWLQKYNETQADGRVVEGKGVYDLGVFPNWKFNFSTIWGLDRYGAGLNLRFINGFQECEDNDCNSEPRTYIDENDVEQTVQPRDVESYATADLFTSYTLRSGAGTSKFTLGINNLFNTPPAIIYNGFLATSDASTYDFLGRYFYARFVQTF
jgi:iron complex outermembrane recepter protein